MSKYIDFNFPVNKETIDFLYNKQLTLDQLLYLYSIREDKLESLDILLKDNSYREKVILSLIIKNIVTIDHKLTKLGNELIALYELLTNSSSGFNPIVEFEQSKEEIDLEEQQKLVKAVSLIMKTTTPLTIVQNSSFDEDFKELWNLFPLTDSWVNNGFKLPHARTLRNSKNICYDKYKKILSDKKNSLSHRDIINALKFEIWHRKKSSTNVKNEMTYMQGITTWLTQRTFEGYYELWVVTQNNSKQINLDEYENRSISNNNNTFVKRLV